METKTNSADDPPLVPDTLTVVLIDDTATYIAIVHENEWRPYAKRTVQIRLTDEQRRQIAPRSTGRIGGKRTHEHVLQAWLEPATKPLERQPS